jgi:putrescine transport system permease protein
MGWLLVLFAIPFVIVLKISFSETRLAMPPYAPLFESHNGSPATLNLHLSNYAFLFTDPLYIRSYLYSLQVAAVSTLLCLLIGYPMAYAISRSSATTRNVLLMLIVLPFWTSFLLRVYAWIGLLKNNGVINNVLLYFGIIHEPVTLLQTDFAVYIGIVYSYLPFMILPLYSNLEKHDHTLLEAAADLGARPFTAFRRITLPLSLPGIAAGSLLVFIPAVGEYVIPSLLGRTDQLMIGRVLSDEFFENRDWPVASAVAILMLLLLVVPIVLFQRLERRELETHQ